MMEQMYHYTKVRERVWQIRELENEFNEHMTLVQGDDLAILFDTGSGNGQLREFVESVVKTPYIVINSHGHPDHILGDSEFDAIYAKKEEWDVLRYYAIQQDEDYKLPMIRELTVGQVFDLGGLHAKVIDLRGHTKGSIGLLLEEERLLLSGDAINETLWMFNYGVLPLSEFRKTLVRLKKLPFDTFLCGHSDEEKSKALVEAHLRNLEQLSVDPSTKQFYFGIETYASTYELDGIQSTIIFELKTLV